ncbi:hypothetical protein FACS1894162_2090 [Bacteroidia bacterium]|nr:hypothetical protein FACS1894162_2090 [Bacteroidia bacterium]
MIKKIFLLIALFASSIGTYAQSANLKVFPSASKLADPKEELPMLRSPGDCCPAVARMAAAVARALITQNRALVNNIRELLVEMEFGLQQFPEYTNTVALSAGRCALDPTVLDPILEACENARARAVANLDRLFVNWGLLDQASKAIVPTSVRLIRWKMYAIAAGFGI